MRNPCRKGHAPDPDAKRCRTCDAEYQRDRRRQKKVPKRSVLRDAWFAMCARCSKPQHPWYSRYGGRGVAVCDEWRDDFEAFRKWAVKSGYAPGLQIDRIDNDGPYSPDNCRWVTCTENNNNRSTSIPLDFHGRIRTVAQVAREFHLCPESIRYCIKKRGMSPSEALTYLTRLK